MMKHIGLLVAILMGWVNAMAGGVDADTAKVLKTEKTVVDRDLPFAHFDSIVHHASVLYASKILYENGFHLAYGDGVRQGRRSYSDFAFVKGAEYDDAENKWLVTDGVPYTYVRLVYADEFGVLCHYQIKFRNRIGYALFFGEALKAGYLLYEPSKALDKTKDFVSVYYRYEDQSYLKFTECVDNTFMVECWYEWSNFKVKKQKKRK